MNISESPSFGGYLATANAVKGPEIPDRPNHANFINACMQEGLTDAAGHIYDKWSFASDAPMTFERRCSSWLGVALGKAMDKRHDDLYMARDIISRTRAALVEVEGKRVQAEADIREVEQQIETARATLADPTHPLFEPLADVFSEPERDNLGAKPNGHNQDSLWSRGATDVWTSLRKHSWKKSLLWLALVAGEIGLIYGIALQLGDAESSGALVALSLSALAVGIGWLAIPTLLQPASPLPRKILSGIALFFYLITMLGLGWLRYVYMRPEVVALLEDAADDPRALIAVPWYGDILFFLFWVALPLALTVTMALLETHYAKDVEHAGSKEGGDKKADSALRAGLTGDRKLLRARGQLVGHLKYLRTHRNQLQDHLVTLRAEEAHGQAAQEDAKLSETSINERTRVYLLSLPEMIGEGLTAYLKGLERGFGDPTMTAHIQESAEPALLRYTEAAYSKVNEYLVHLNDHDFRMAPETTLAGDL